MNIYRERRLSWLSIYLSWRMDICPPMFLISNALLPFPPFPLNNRDWIVSSGLPWIRPFPKEETDLSSSSLERSFHYRAHNFPSIKRSISSSLLGANFLSFLPRIERNSLVLYPPPPCPPNCPIFYRINCFLPPAFASFGRVSPKHDNRPASYSRNIVENVFKNVLNNFEGERKTM